MVNLAPTTAAAAAILVFAQSDVTSGIITFAVGIIVGLVSVLVTDRLVRRRMVTDYDAWVRSGCPERRRGGRRAPG